ncbi:MAG: ABC transporter ATP-binding protein [Actinomycetota bacterium]|nr:ABC transporter ATP-binding protein [Actinomycetota bacterium]MDQ3715330.1 ABC transporter ATP-binding protein [Actinomycetota bacterium]
MTTVIQVDHVSKGFVLRRGRSLKELAVLVTKGRPLTDKFQAINDLSLTVEQGETVGLLGLNGSGKSTLLKLISGVMRPDNGTVRVRGHVAGLIEVGAGLHPDLTGRENIFLNGAILGMSEAELRRQFDSIVEFSEIEAFLDTEVKFYSSGMFLRLAFSVAVHTEPDIFLVDEILAVGDEPFQRKCLARIKQLSGEGRTLIVVSHDIDSVAEVCGRGILLDHGHKIVDGSFDEAVVRLRAP